MTKKISFTERTDGVVYIRCKVKEKLTVGINILKNSEGWYWDPRLWIEGSQVGKDVIMKDNTFIFKEKQIEVTEHFCYLINVLKKHPTYRLKMINKLDKKYMEIWKKS